MPEQTIALLPGDCIGPEVAREARRALETLLDDVTIVERPLGAAAIRETGSPLPEETLTACRESAAVLKAPIGDPAFDDEEGEEGNRPLDGILRLRTELGVFLNIRPAKNDDLDLIIVRELLGGLYYGQRGTRTDGTVFDTLEYKPAEVDRIVRAAAGIARDRRGHLTSVDKANVLETSRMWRRVAQDVAADFPDVTVDHMLVDNAAMQLVFNPGRFDVIVTENTFGDILSDEAAGLTGGLGMAGSASLAEAGPGLFEPVGGSAPDIAGQGIANPIGMLRATALMLRFGLKRDDLATTLESAVDEAFLTTRTPDVGGTASTVEVGDEVLRRIEHHLGAVTPART